MGSINNKHLDNISSLSGFTLLEMIVSLIIFSIVAGIAAPIFHDSFLRHQLSSNLDRIGKSIAVARSEAVDRYGTNVVICASSNSSSCNTTNWEEGWILFVDNNNNRQYNSGGDTMLKIYGDLIGSGTLRSTGFDSSGVISFNSEGFPDSGGAFVVCNELGLERAMAVIVNVVGQVRLAVEEDGTDQVVNIELGENISCPG